MSGLSNNDSPTTPSVRALADQHPLLGLALLHHKNTRGKPMSFRDRPYLVELYCDAPKIDGFDAMKCVQVGWSELLIQLVLERAGWSGRICGYVLPSYQLRDRFVRRRVVPLIGKDNDTAVKAYQSKVPSDDHGSLRHKRFGKGALLFLGSNAVNDFIEFSADVLVVDEFDRCDQTNLAFARDRLRASDNPQLFRISNPTVPGGGIAELYDNGDGRKWHHRCTRCGEMQPIDWFVNVVERDDTGRWQLRDRARAREGDVRPVCRRCKKPWDRTPKGEWVAERPQNGRRSYHVSRMDVLNESLRDLFAEWNEVQGNPDKMVAFYAGVLGLPYSAEGSSVTPDMLHRAAIGDPMDHGGDSALKHEVVVAGVDVGTVLHVDICKVVEDLESGKKVRRGVWTGEVTSFEAVFDIFVRYSVHVAVVDARPETRKAQELRDKAIRTGVCDVWLCEFHKTPKVGAQDFGMSLNWDRHVVRVDRTQLLDSTLSDLTRDPPHRTWPEDIWQIRHWQSQMEAPKRVRSKNTDDYIWDNGRKDDHFRFSDAYSRVAMAMLEMQGSYHG
tara:strand:+ start:580 stop:2250 length:1671 start_codon:yes stop_codon:yes gene_type:complete